MKKIIAALVAVSLAAVVAFAANVEPTQAAADGTSGGGGGGGATTYLLK